MLYQFTQFGVFVALSLYLHRDAALQFELQLDHVHFLVGAELGELNCSSLHFIYGHIHWLKLHLLLPHHLYALLHVREGVGSWGHESSLRHACQYNKLNTSEMCFSQGHIQVDLSSGCLS